MPLYSRIIKEVGPLKVVALRPHSGKPTVRLEGAPPIRQKDYDSEIKAAIEREGYKAFLYPNFMLLGNEENEWVKLRTVPVLRGAYTEHPELLGPLCKAIFTAAEEARREAARHSTSTEKISEEELPPRIVRILELVSQLTRKERELLRRLLVF